VQPNVAPVFGDANEIDIAKVVSSYPLSDESRKSMLRLLIDEIDYLKGSSRDEKIRTLRATSYIDFLKRHVNVTPEAATVFRDNIKGLWGIGWDALSTLEAYRQDMPGTHGLGIGELDNELPGRDEPYIFHFPDGNAGVARSQVRLLIPEAVPGHTMEDLVKSRVDYGLLDQESSNTRIRLNSTAVKVGHVDRDRHVDVTYVHNGEVHRVRAKHTILACNNDFIPHLCAEVPEKQKEAIAYATKVPLVYISVAIRNWKAFENLGYYDFYIPQGILMHTFGMDFPVSMGGYDYTQKSNEPTVLHGTYVPTVPDQGLKAREQHIAGRRRLYEQTYDELERDIVRQMSGALEGGGFDAERDIAAITVNRWPHGYAYEYNDYADPPDFNRYKGPHLAGAAQIGRISIANCDASGYAYINGAIDSADRAVNEQIG
jgi:spermidine dehydrogenase